MTLALFLLTGCATPREDAIQHYVDQKIEVRHNRYWCENGLEENAKEKHVELSYEQIKAICYELYPAPTMVGECVGLE